MKTKIDHFPAKTQTSVRTARWPWLWLSFLVQLLRLIISRLFHLAPIPPAQNAIPTRKPLRVFAFWKLCFSLPCHFRRAIAQILVQPNVIIEKREFANCLLKPCFAFDFNQSNRALEGAEKAFDAAIHPRRMRIAALMLDSEHMHRPRKIGRHQSAIVIRPKRFWLAERFNQPIQHVQNRICTSMCETQRQQSAAAVIDHAQKRVGFRANRDVRPIQGPSLVRLCGLWRLAHYFTQLQYFIAGLFAQLGHIGFTDRFTSKGEAGVEHGGYRAAANVAARLGQQTQHFGLYPAGFAVFACAVIALSLSGQLAAGERVRSPVLEVL